MIVIVVGNNARNCLLNESSLDYIGGLFMKNKNKFSSYAEALKRLELLRSQELQEETKFVLKSIRDVLILTFFIKCTIYEVVLIIQWTVNIPFLL